MARRRFDEANSRDPNTERVDGVPRPRELVYAERLTNWVLELCPQASEALRLAARAQHICRWMIPRDSFPATRAGYLHWREELKKFHSQRAGAILLETGYSAEIVERVQALNLKQNFPHDPEGRVLEDALCLVFLEHQFAALAARMDEAKLILAVRKTWKKMTPAGQGFARQLKLREADRALIEKAIRHG